VTVGAGAHRERNKWNKWRRRRRRVVKPPLILMTTRKKSWSNQGTPGGHDPERVQAEPIEVEQASGQGTRRPRAWAPGEIYHLQRGSIRIWPGKKGGLKHPAHEKERKSTNTVKRGNVRGEGEGKKQSWAVTIPRRPAGSTGRDTAGTFETFMNVGKRTWKCGQGCTIIGVQCKTKRQRGAIPEGA